jgi:superfamily II DNA/RNA helicase
VYALPILAGIDPTRASIQAVIVVPTRELGLQVVSVLKQLSQASPKKIMIMPLVEGSKNRRQQLWAVAEPPHIIVGNPKSLQRLVDTGRLRLNSVSYVVLDEVDACLSNTDTKQDLHELLSRRLSNTYREVEDSGTSSISRVGGCYHFVITFS